jgi:acyl transferase domain-containing protein/acyl carrier protein
VNNDTSDQNYLDVAIIGMAGRFPGARNVDEFWRNLKEGRESISTFSDEELLAAGVSKQTINDRHYVKAGGMLEGIDLFDASFFGYSPREAELMDPQQRMFLECAWEAMEHAGYDSETYEGLVGVYAGASMNLYLLFNLLPNRATMAAVDHHLIKIGSDSTFIAPRTSYKLNLEGPSLSIQTACSTSLVAIHTACQALLSYQCDMAIAGGVSISSLQKRGYRYLEGGLFSPDGHCRALDAKAQGTVGGNGLGVVILKRLADAIADNDNIQAVIKGSAINNDGSLKMGFMAPREDGQAKVINLALSVAGVEPETINYVEAHGSGTLLGDPIEMAALTKAFRAGTDKKNFCAVGSVKTNVGHLDAAAGVAGLIKTVLAMQHEMIPASLHFERPNPEIDFANSPFYVNSELREWKRKGHPRRAGVSSFGIGGTNAHLILEEAPERSASGPGRPSQLLLLSARSATALEQMTTNLAEHLHAAAEVKLADVAYTLALGRRSFAQRRTVVCESAADAAEALASRDPRRVLSSVQAGSAAPVAFMFSGVGDHYVNMGRELYRSEPVFRQTVDECCELLRPHLDGDLGAVLYPAGEQMTPAGLPSPLDFRRLRAATEEPADEATRRLNQTALTQPAVFVIDYALARLWQSWGVEPEALIGYSLGEYVAACLAGVFTLPDALWLVARRAQMIDELPQGVMLAVSLPEAEVASLLGEELSLAAVNTSTLCVVAGTAAAVTQLEEQLMASGVVCRRLQTSHAFHSRMMEPLRESFARVVAGVARRAPVKPYVSNVTGEFIRAEQATDPHYWGRHLCETVRFAAGLETLLQRAGRLLLEVGPGQALSSHAWQHLALQPEQVVLSTLGHRQERQSEAAMLQRTLGRLWLSGVGVDWQGYYGAEQRRRVPLPSYPFERQRSWIEAPAAGAKQAELESERTELADWFYRPVWKQAEGLPRFAAAGESQPWLLFADECGVAERLTERLREAGQEVIVVRAGREFWRTGEQSYEVNPGSAADNEKLVTALAGQSYSRLIHLWGVTADAGQRREWQERGFYSLLWLAQALGKVVSQRVELLVVTNNMQQVSGAEAVWPEKATVLGPCRVLSQEYANLSCRSVDVELAERGAERLSAQLLSEFGGRSKGEKVVAYRGAQRWVQEYEARRLDETSDESWLRPRGVYLITGGMGGIGQEIARSLAQRVQARLVLLGRRTLDEAGARRVQELEALGAEVLVQQADVRDREQMEAVLRQSRERFGPLHGVIHAAGIAGGGLMQFKTAEQAAAVLGAKLAGTLLLAELLEEQEEELDFLMLCSSLTAVLGGVGQSDYCGANAFLDAFAQSESGRGRRTVAINWDAWRNVGMAGKVRFRVGGNEGADVFELGLRVGIEAEQGVEALQRIMAGTRLPQVLISRRELHSAIKSADEWRDSSLIEEIEKQNGLVSHPRPNIHTSYVPPESEIEQKICHIWQGLLGIDQVGIHDSFFELGGDSLIGLQVVHHVREQLNVEVPLTIIYEGPTVSSLAQLVSGDHNKTQVYEMRAARGERRRRQRSLRYESATTTV